MGLGKSVISPEVGAKFGGFALERESPVTGIHDDLWAVAVVITSDDATVALVSCDLQTISPDVVSEIRGRAAGELAIPPTHLLVAATHVHSAPGGDFSERQIPGVDCYYAETETVERITEGIWQALCTAHKTRKESVLHAASGEIVGIGASRHIPGEPDRGPAHLIIAQDPATHRNRFAIAAYGCHPSVLGPDNTKVSADYPGVVRSALGQNLGVVPVQFLNMASGDISTRGTRREQTIAEVIRLGNELSDQMRSLRPSLSPVGGVIVSGTLASIDVELQPNLIEKIRAKLAETSESSLRHRRLTMSLERLSHIEDDSVPCEIQVIRCGEIAFVGVAAELFSAVASEIGSRSPTRTTVVVAPANGTIGNVPGPDLHPTVNPIVSDRAAEQITRTAHSLLIKLFGHSTCE